MPDHQLITTSQARNWRCTAWARNPSPPGDPADRARTRHRHEPHCRRIGPCLRSCHGAAGFQRAIFVAVDGDASFGRLVVESFRSRPAESRTPCSNEPRSRRPLRNVQTQWDEGALSNPGAGIGNWKSGSKRARKKKEAWSQRRGNPKEDRRDGRKDCKERVGNFSYGQEEEEWRQRQR